MLSFMFKPIRIVLHKTSHPGNIGAVARAMKTMGLSELYLVAPKCFPHPEAIALATHAEDILQQAVVVPDLLSALTDMQVVYATSANTRDVDLPIKAARDAARDIISQISHRKIAIIFGPENHGLSNQDLLHAHRLIQIPTTENYHSLNLAAAVQIIAYELLLASEAILPSQSDKEELASVEHLEHFYHQLEKAVIQLKLLDPQNPRQLMLRLRRLFNRAQLNAMEVNILSSIFHEVNQEK
jgi:TrmH family RNA methyltransferase